jgi:hypothetical protein
VACKATFDGFDSHKALHLQDRGDVKPWWADVAHNHGYGRKRFDSYLRYHLPDVPGGPETLVAFPPEFDPLIRLHASLVQR